MSEVLDALSDQVPDSRSRPLHDWHPEHCYDIDIRIDREGRWFHEGREIERRALVLLFASILMRDELGRYSLVTPAERAYVEVEDAPFVAGGAQELGEQGEGVWTFTTNLDEQIRADQSHRIEVHHDEEGNPRPYIGMAHRLCARIDRASFLALASAAIERNGRLGIFSAGVFMPLDEPAA